MLFILSDQEIKLVWQHLLSRKLLWLLNLPGGLIYLGVAFQSEWTGLFRVTTISCEASAAMPGPPVKRMTAKWGRWDPSRGIRLPLNLALESFPALLLDFLETGKSWKASTWVRVNPPRSLHIKNSLSDSKSAYLEKKSWKPKLNIGSAHIAWKALPCLVLFVTKRLPLHHQRSLTFQELSPATPHPAHLPRQSLFTLFCASLGCLNDFLL